MAGPWLYFIFRFFIHYDYCQYTLFMLFFSNGENETTVIITNLTTKYVEMREGKTVEKFILE